MRPRQIRRCPHTRRPYRALGLCRACYLKQNGGNKRWYAAHKIKAIRRATQWNQSHSLRRRKIAAKSARKAYATIHGQLTSNLRARINSALAGKSKYQRLSRLIGCSISQLRVWLEKQFQSGMTWSNHTRLGWHVDHKKPCSSFDLRKPSQQRLCFHFTNLQPLWWRDNLSKGSRVI